MVQGPSLSPELLEIAQRAEAVATGAGLSFFEVVFEMLDAVDVNAIAAYGGFPVRYSSWRFGMEFERLSKGYDWGLSKIYELVVNNDPTIAYLVRSNSLMEQKLVMAHVFGHADFFRNNAWFAPTERRMLERFEEHARRIHESVARHGQEPIERCLDRALSLEALMDPHGPLRRHRAAESHGRAGVDRSQSERSRAALGALMGGPQAGKEVGGAGTLSGPTFDILPFLVDHAPVEPWERDILGIVAAEAEYFMPQRMTKIINEGWASFWHSRMLTGGLLDASEVIEFADCHSGATYAAPGQLNPYKLGIDLFRHAERRGLDLFRLRSVHNDVTFVDQVMDEAFVAESNLFVVEKGRGDSGKRIGSRSLDEVKGALLRDLSWAGQPRVELLEVVPGTGEMVLRHDHDGRDLRLDEAGEMLRTLEAFWKHPVHLLTQEGDEERRLISEKGELRMREGKRPSVA